MAGARALKYLKISVPVDVTARARDFTARARGRYSTETSSSTILKRSTDARATNARENEVRSIRIHGGWESWRFSTDAIVDMTALERAFERWRTDGLNVVTLAERIEGDKGTASASAKVRGGDDSRRALGVGSRRAALGAEKHEEAIEAYDECLSKCVKGWMNGRAEYSALVAMACGMSEGTRRRREGECRVAPYRAVAGTALSGRAVASSRAGAWSDALRDAEAALDSAPDISITHERARLILQRAGRGSGVEYDQFASKIAGKRTSNLRRSNTFDGDSTDELYDAGERSHESALKCIDAEEWIRARQSMLHGAGVLFAKRDNERIYRDRVSFLERAKSIYVAKAADLPEETVQTTWLDNAFVLAGFDNLSDAEKSNVCLTIGNIFTWVGNFAGASELYSCGINVVMTADDAGSFDDLEQTLKSNRVLSQLSDRQDEGLEERAQVHGGTEPREVRRRILTPR